MPKFGDIVGIQYLNAAYNLCVVEELEEKPFLKCVTWISSGDNQGLHWVEKIHSSALRFVSHLSETRESIAAGERVKLRAISASPVFIANEPIDVSSRCYKVLWITEKNGITPVEIPGVFLQKMSLNA